MTKTKEKKINIDSLADLPGVGPVSLKKLNEKGYDTMFQVRTELKIHDFVTITGMDRSRAVEAFKFIDKALDEAGLLPKMTQRGTDVLKERLSIDRILTGCKSFDHLFWHDENPHDGVEYGTTTEIFGEPGVGKTQISHLLALKILTKHKDKLVAYIDTEDTFRPERIIQMAKVREFTDEEIENFLDRVIRIKVFNANMQIIALENLGKAMANKEMNIGMLIVDSGTALFREEFMDRGVTKLKFNLLNKMCHLFKNMAEMYKIPALFVNQVYQSPDPEMGKNKWIHFGGNIVAHTNSYRIRLEKIGEGRNKRRATLVKSPLNADNDALYKISERGIIDVE